jgi:AraC-like DNA-binding protein
MVRNNAVREVADLRVTLKNSRSDSISYRQVFEAIGRTLPIAEGMMVSTMPRGSLQIVQPAKLPEPLLRGYTRGLHAYDRLTWTSILRRRPVTGDQSHGGDGFAASPYLRELLAPNGLRYAAAAPLTAPVLGGYAGAVHVYRTEAQGRFDSSELELLGHFASQLDELIAKARGNRREPGDACALTARPRGRQLVFDERLEEILPDPTFDQLDARLREQLVDAARQRLHHLNGTPVTSDRLQLPDSRGDLWTFRVVTYKTYPAIGDGPYVLFCMQPNCAEWGAVRPSDFAADAELSRLIPALKFMQAEFHRSPTLGEIAKTVHLSPFHFHRRFAELLGLTPKHYLLDCQIAEAKRQLVARKKDLADIATDCGFAHQSHFTSRFKQATGLTPTRWRRLALEAQGSASD